MEFLGIGWMEMIIIGLVALIVVGPERLPQAAQTVGKIIGYISQQVTNIKQEIRQPVENELVDLKGKFEEIRQPVANELADFKGQFQDTIQDVTDIEPISEQHNSKPPEKH